MGKRSSQRKKACKMYDSDDDCSVSSSSTVHSDFPLDQGIEDVHIDDFTVLEQCVDDLHEKRGSIREKALSVVVELFCKSLQHEFVEKNFATVLHLCLNSVKRGSAREIFLACKAIGLLALTVGCGDSAHEILVESVATFSHALKSPSQSSSPLLECLAIITFVGGNDPEETEKSMLTIWQSVNSKLGSNVVARKAPAAATVMMVSAWAFLLTTLDGRGINSKSWEGAMSYFSTLLDKDDRSIRIATGEAVGLIFEMGCLEKFCARASVESSVPERNNSLEVHTHQLGLKGKIINQVRDLSTEAGGKGVTKKDLSAQRNLFQGILEFLEYGACPETSTKISVDVVKTSTWCEMIQMNFLKHFLGGGFVKHMQENELLHEVFGFAPRKYGSKNEKKVSRWSKSAHNKARDQDLNKQRTFVRERNVGYFAVGLSDEEGEA